MIKKLLLTLLLLTLIGCKTGYDKVEPVMKGQPKDLPASYKTPKGATVYAQTPPSPLALDLVDRGVSNTILRAKRNNPNFNPPDAWTRWDKFLTHKETRVMLMPTIDRSEDPNYLGCPVLETYYGRVAGIVFGIIITNSAPKDEFAMIIVPELTDTRVECQSLFRDGIDHEQEHLITLNDDNLWFSYTGQYDIHPIFP